MASSILYADDKDTSPAAMAYLQAFNTLYESLGDVSDPQHAAYTMIDLVKNSPENYQVDALLAYMTDFFDAYEGTENLELARLTLREFGVRARLISREPNSISTSFLQPGFRLKNRFVKQFPRVESPAEGRVL
jgi:hypothetical protein